MGHQENSRFPGFRIHFAVLVCGCLAKNILASAQKNEMEDNGGNV